MENDAMRLLDPQKSFHDHFLPTFKQNVNELFESLLRESSVDVDANRKTAEAYRKAAAEAGEAEKKRRALSRRKIFCIVVCVLAGFLILYGIGQPNALCAALSAVVLAGGLTLIFAYLRPQIKVYSEKAQKAGAQAERTLREAEKQVSPLLCLFDSAMSNDLVQKTLPTLTFDRHFDMRRYDYLHGKYGLAEDYDRQASTLGLLSGEILGNPFLFERVLTYRMGMQVYTGMLTIHWVTYSKDQEGHTVTHHHSQVLTASVRKPKPFFTPKSSLVYGNDAAPDLSFTHEKTHAESMSEQKLKSFIRSRTRKIQRKSEKNASFTEMGNEKFDAVFGATDRDNEVQFRLLFTPLAQKNMMDLMTQAAPFGDDFNFIKRKNLNFIVSDHSQKWNPDTDTGRYFSYEVALIREKFLSLNIDYFTNIYFDLAPLLAIPLYQQMKPREYIYRSSYERNYPVREAEVMANKLGDRYFAHPGSVTPAVLKTSFVKKSGATDIISVHALSYRTVHHTDHVPVLGGDGHIHPVPVHWLEYIPLTRETEMELKELELTEREYQTSAYARMGKGHAYFRRLFATVGKSGALTDASPDLIDDENVDYGDVVEAALDEAAEHAEDTLDPKT